MSPSPSLAEPPDLTPEQAVAIMASVAPVGSAVPMDGNLAAAPAMLEHLAKLGYRLTPTGEATAPLLAAVTDVLREWDRRQSPDPGGWHSRALVKAVNRLRAIVPAEPPEAP